MEIKCPLDATEFLIADLIVCSTCFGHHYAHHQELKSIIQWLLPVVFGVVVFKLLVWCGAEGYVFALQDAGLLTRLLGTTFASKFSTPSISTIRIVFKYLNISLYLILTLSFERFSDQKLTHISPLSSYEVTARAFSRVSYDSFI